MATLTVTASHDYSGDSLSDITDIVFQSGVIATFAADQFDDAQISSSVHITGASPPFISGEIEIKNAHGFSAGNWTFTNWDFGTVQIFGTSAADIIVGSSTSDQFEAGAGADILAGGSGDDYFFYGTGSDVSSGESVDGGAGVDTIMLGGTSNDVFDFTVASLSNLERLLFNSFGTTAKFTDSQFAPITAVAGLSSSSFTNNQLVVTGAAVNLSGVTFTSWHNGHDTIAINGTTGNDSLTGSSQDDTFDGGAGADTLTGGAGDDTYILADIHRTDPFQLNFFYDTVVEAPNGGIDTVEVEKVGIKASYALPAEVENGVIVGSDSFALFGNDLDNHLTGNSAANTLSGGGGADTLLGGGGADSLDGGAGEDTASYAGSPASVNINLAAGTASGGDAQGDILTNIEDLIGSGVSDTLTGTSGANVIDGGAGADTMTGGNGNDTYVVDNSGDVVIEGPAEGTDSVRTTLASYTLSANLENLTFTNSVPHTGTGNAVANAMTGGIGDDVLFGGGGKDTLDGGFGNDTLVGNDGGAGAFLHEANILTGGAGNDTLVAEVSDSISGGAGLDTLQAENANPWTINLGSVSIETMLAGFGNDHIDGSTQSVGVTVFASGGNDTVTGSSHDDFLWGGVGNDTLTGGTGNDLVFGDLGADSLSGGDGNDTLYGDNSDTLVNGGAGTDALYWAAGANANINVGADAVEFVQTLGDNDTLNGSTATANLVLFAGGGTDNVSGGSGNDFLWGEAGDDVLTGNAGNDTIVGGTGADRITGGAGTDNLYGADGSNSGDGAVDKFIFAAGWGTDFVYGFDDGIDKLDMTALHTTFAALTVTSVNGNADVDFGTNHIIVVGQATHIDAGDFLF